MTCLALWVLCAADPVVLGRPVVKWVQDLEHASPKVRRGGAFALGEPGPAAAFAVPQLFRTLDRKTTRRSSDLGRQRRPLRRLRKETWHDLPGVVGSVRGGSCRAGPAGREVGAGSRARFAESAPRRRVCPWRGRTGRCVCRAAIDPHAGPEDYPTLFRSGPPAETVKTAPERNVA